MNDKTPLLRITMPSAGPIGDRLLGLMKNPLEKMLHLPALNGIYERASLASTGAGDSGSFSREALADHGVSIRISDKDLARIPEKGSLVVVANHPFGAIEGLVMDMLLRQVRPDVKLMANYMLAQIPEMAERIIQVDPFGTKSSAARNMGPLKESLRYLKEGGCLGVFPAGEVASFHPRRGVVTDTHWSTTIARIVKRTKAPVVPMFFAGRNSLLFQTLGLIHPRLRTVMLPREFMRQKNGSIEVRIGSPIQARRLSEFESDHDAMEYLRLHTYVLKKRPPIKENTISPGLPVAAAEPTDGVPIIDPVDPDTLEAEFEALPPEQVMVETDKFKVFLGSKEDIPNAVREIGRLREVTFREVGEGTGREIDLDEFDDIYLHLVLWSRKDREIAGAYRIGRSDRILEKYGKDSLYTNTLFRYKKPFLNFLRKHPALELGRSFITSKYQRSYFPLMLLWKGIGAFVMNNMDYNILYGPVSISSDYNDFSRELMIRFLRLHNRPRSFKKLVKPITPPRIKPSPIAGMITRSAKSLVRDIDDLAALIQEIETDQKGVPVLLRQYLKLGAKLLAFNVDHDFNQCLDGLMLVDLTETDPKILSRYIGSDAAEAFMAHHADKDPGADAQSAMSASA